MNNEEFHKLSNEIDNFLFEKGISKQTAVSVLMSLAVCQCCMEMEKEKFIDYVNDLWKMYYEKRNEEGQREWIKKNT